MGILQQTYGFWFLDVSFRCRFIMHKVNEYSDQASKKNTQELLAIAEDETQAQEYRLAAIWELDKRNEATENILEFEARLRQGWEANRKRRIEPKKYSTFWPRFLAAILDSFVIFFIFFFPLGLLLTIDHPILYSYNWEIITDILVYGYFIGMHAKRGQTVGKKAAGVKVVRYSDEKPIGLNEAFKRDMVPIALLLCALLANIFTDVLNVDYDPYGLIFYIDNLASIWFLAEIITMLTNKKSRAIHDFIAGTVVIRTH